MKKTLKRLFNKTKWYNLRSLAPVSSVFGLDRGIPIDRIYIEDFLANNAKFITGTVLEIAENTYSKKYGIKVENYEVLHTSSENSTATIIGDLTDINTLPECKVDCFICTQTLNFIYDFKKAIQGGWYILKLKGIMLSTVSGISQISKYDMERWGDYWRFTTISIKKSFEEVFGNGNVEVDFYGNVLSAISFLEGISSEELTKNELFYKDKNYPVTIVIKALKR